MKPALLNVLTAMHSEAQPLSPSIIKEGTECMLIVFPKHLQVKTLIR